MEKEYIVSCETPEQSAIVLKKLYPELITYCFWEYIKAGEESQTSNNNRDHDVAFWKGKYPVYTFGEWKRMIDVKLVTDLKKDEAIICQNLKEAKAIRQLMHDAGLTWLTDNSYLSNHGKGCLCFYPAEGMGTWGLGCETTEEVIAFTERKGSKWFPASDFLQNTDPFKSFNASDVIVCDTKEEARAIELLLHQHGYKWNGRETYLAESRAGKAPMYYRPQKGTHDTYHNVQEEYKQHKATQFINLTTKPMKSVTQEQLKEIHRIACSSWKPRIEEYAKRNVFGDVSLTDKEVQEMFEAATGAQKPVLEKIFGKAKATTLYDQEDETFSKEKGRDYYHYRYGDKFIVFKITDGKLRFHSTPVDDKDNWDDCDIEQLGKEIEI